jgi:hypothetical protein
MAVEISKMYNFQGNEEITPKYVEKTVLMLT